MKRLLRSTYEHLAIYFGLALLGIICLVWTPFAVLLYPILPERWGRPLGRLAITLGFRLHIRALALTGTFRFDLSALDTLKDQGPMILAPNHPSLLDAVMIISRLPNVACIIKAALVDNILFGAGARLARYIRNDCMFSMSKLALEDLKRGSQLLLFPEGTRTTRVPVNPFKGSVALLASKSGVPVQTIFIETDSPYLGKGWPLLRQPVMPITYRLRLGRRFYPQDNVHAFLAELESYYVLELADLTADQSCSVVIAAESRPA